MENIAIEYFSKQELTCTTIPTIRTVRENSTIFGPIAQWIEHRSSKPRMMVRFHLGVLNYRSPLDTIVQVAYRVMA